MTKAKAPRRRKPAQAAQAPQESKPDMAAPKGNRFWEARSSHGRNPIFATPEDLWSAAVEYFGWVADNPLWEDKLVIWQGAASHEPVAKMRAMTLAGLCIFLDIGRNTWDEYCKREGFSGVTGQIAEIIRNQKFEGAAADLLNANIIAREIGLADKQELSGPGGGPVQTETTLRPTVTRDQWLALHGGAEPTPAEGKAK